MSFASRILFPVDYSASSAVIAPAVAAVARRWNVPVTMLHAGPEPGAGATPFLEKELAGLMVERKFVTGEPARVIIAEAAAMDRPFIMMPTRGTTAFRQLLLGSVTAAVLHDVGCPVWTTAHCIDGGPIPDGYRSIVCAVDLGPLTATVLKTAAAFAGSFEAELHVVHSVPGIDPRFESGPANRAHAFLVDSARRDYPAIAAAAGVDRPLEVVEEVELAAGINQAAARHHADLLVIGRGVVQGVLGRLRTNAHDLIRQSRCPVLSV